MWGRLKRFRYGEAFLWLAFALASFGGLSDHNDTAITFAGICVAAAIGVRATRPLLGSADVDR